jgi:hypothetical protein
MAAGGDAAAQIPLQSSGARSATQFAVADEAIARLSGLVSGCARQRAAEKYRRLVAPVRPPRANTIHR